MSFPVIPEDRHSDLHNMDLLPRADLVVFMAGNQFMLMPELVSAFQRNCPEVENIVYETLPPGLELQQILAGGARFCGRDYPIQADVYTSVSRQAMETLVQNGLVSPGDFFPYVHNRLALMVRAGNPRGIESVSDLGRSEVVVSQPSPEYEHIAEYVQGMYLKAGGEELRRLIMEEKAGEKTTIYTTVHHRETPWRILQGEADVGPVWATEILQAEDMGLGVEGVEVPPDQDQRDAVNYYIAPLVPGKNAENTDKFLNFIGSDQAADIFARFGFLPAGGE